MAHFGTLIFETVTFYAHGESCQRFLNDINRLYISAIGTYIAYNPDCVSL